jgi:V/A-type H+-transporting ATPase subunit E
MRASAMSLSASVRPLATPCVRSFSISSCTPTEKEGSLAYFVVRQSKEMLSNGITFKVGDEKQTSMTFRLREKNIEIDLDNTSVSAMLLKHLQPRFRALLEGIIT